MSRRSKFKKAETFFLEFFQTLGAEVFWNEFQTLWFNDFEFESLGDVRSVPEGLLKELHGNLYDVNPNSLPEVPREFLYDEMRISKSSQLENSLKNEFVQRLGTRLDIREDSVIPQNLWFWLTTNNISGKNFTDLWRAEFSRDEVGEFGFIYLPVAVHSWPFDDNFRSKIDSQRSGRDLAEVRTDLYTPYLQHFLTPKYFPSFIAISEIFHCLCESPTEKNKLMRVLGDKGRRGSMLLNPGTGDAPLPNFRLRPAVIAHQQEGRSWSSGYPLVLEFGYKIRSVTDTNDFWRQIFRVPSIARSFIDELYSESKGELDQPFSIFGSQPNGTNQKAEMIPALFESLLAFNRGRNYNGSWNSYVYGFLLPGLAEGRVSLGLIEETLGFIESEAERTIALGNLALANLVIGKFAEAGHLTLAMAESASASDESLFEHCMPEAFFLGESLASLTGDTSVLDKLDDLSKGRAFPKYKTPAWLDVALSSLAKPRSLEADVSSRISNRETNLDLIHAIESQMRELMPVLQDFEFIQLHDGENLRPSVSLSASEGNMVCIIVTTKDKRGLPSFPWLRDDSKYEDVVEYWLSRDFFIDGMAKTRFLTELFDTYNRVELELVPLASTSVKVRTILPIRPPQQVQIAAPSKNTTGPSSGGYSGPRFVFGLTRDISEDLSGFDAGSFF